jgi:hypothetical protein
MAGDQQPGYVYFYDEGVHTMTRCLCHLELRDPQRAALYAHQAVNTLDRSYARNVALATVHLSVAYAQSGEVDEAARLLGDAGAMAACNSSARLVGQLAEARTALRPWQHTTLVQALDERLASFGLA